MPNDTKATPREPTEAMVEAMHAKAIALIRAEERAVTRIVAELWRAGHDASPADTAPLTFANEAELLDYVARLASPLARQRAQAAMREASEELLGDGSVDADEDAAWSWLESKFLNVEAGHDPNDRDYSADEMVDAFIAGRNHRLAHSPSGEGRDLDARARELLADILSMTSPENAEWIRSGAPEAAALYDDELAAIRRALSEPAHGVGEVAALAEKLRIQTDCLVHYAEQSGFSEKPVPSVFHLQAVHFYDLAKALAALSPNTASSIRAAAFREASDIAFRTPGGERASGAILDALGEELV